MAYFLIQVVFISAAIIAFIQARNWFRWRALNKWGEQYGCGALPVVKNKLPGGIERYAILFTGLKGMDFLEDIIRKRFISMGTNTYRLFSIFNGSIINTAEPENIQALLATQFHDFDLGPSRKSNFHDLLGNGIFTAEGEAWSHFRRQLRPQFSRDQVSDMEAADRHLGILFKALSEENALGWVEGVDLLPLIYRFTMDVSSEFLFGESVNSQSTALHSQDSGNTKDSQKELDFSEAISYAQEFITWRIRLGRLQSMFSSRKFKKACKTVKDFADHFVRIALDPDHKHPPTLPGQKPRYVFLDELVAETRDPIELRDQVLHIMVAGRDTTSALLCWTILLLARHPAELQDLRKAIVSQFGTEKSPTNELTFESLKACKELKNVLYETMRLYPLVPLNGREAVKDTTLPTGGGPDHKQPIAIRKGEQIGYSAYVMHRRKDIWGQDADEFRSARWEGRKLGWEFIGFSGGPRICLGQQYALTEASFVMVKMLQRYDNIEALDMTGKIPKALTLTMAPGNGVKVRMHRADS
ncbi:Cytochrome P450 [Lachnellula subtilissima]|uniref:Cytochrome P450 n=1 Tax=Lachnellula subtilissima TaxID=602034 RepID=A0A8H8RRB2_9HELO|nr:Cytochrome P450 [Lachnellula subtilissima]